MKIIYDKIKYYIITKLTIMKGIIWLAFVTMGLALPCKNCNRQNTIGYGHFAQIPESSDNAKLFPHRLGDELEEAKHLRNFDARKHWPKCSLQIEDIGKCSGAHLFQASTESLSFRYCIKGKPLHLSVQDAVSCDTQSFGCHGGFLDRAWNYLEKEGVVTKECFPFRSNTQRTPYCSAASNCNETNIPYEKYKCKAGSVRRLTEENIIKQEIFHNGPVMAMFEVREDIYKHGPSLYVCRRDEKVLLYFILLGWGEKDDHKYWIGRSTLQSQMGDMGVVKLSINSVCPKLGHVMTCDPDL